MGYLFFRLYNTVEMKTKQIGIAVMFFILLSACSKELEDTYSTELKFPEFINVEILNALAVSIEYGEEQKIIVTGNEFAIKDVITEVIAETLIIDKENDSPEELSYKIITPFIREVKNSSFIDITVGDFEQEGYLNLIVTNKGNITVGQFNNVNLLTANIENDGSIFGNKSFDLLKDLNIKISGNGDYEAFAIEAKNVIAEIDGGGSCSVSASKSLNAIISGSGSVLYKGDPIINTTIYGSGLVIDAN